METKQLITRSMARCAERNQERFASLQVMLNFRNSAVSMLQCFDHNELPDYMELCSIKKVYLCPKEIVMPYNQDYIVIAFDFEPQRTGMEIVKIPERYNVSHFKEKLGKN